MANKVHEAKVKAIYKKYGFKNLDDAINNLEDMMIDIADMISTTVNTNFDRTKQGKEICKLLKSLEKENKKDFEIIEAQWDLQQELEKAKYVEKREKEEYKKYLELKKKFEEKNNGEKD